MHENATSFVSSGPRRPGAYSLVAWLLAALSLPVLSEPVASTPMQAHGAGGTGRDVPLGELVEGMECQTDPTQTYTLYLPSGFTPDRRWPVLLIFDPRGRSVSAAEIFRAAAEDYGWVLVSSNDTRSDGPIEPNLKALNALWPEVHVRYSIDPHRIYAAGFSGGAMLAWALGRQTGVLAGVIASGGRLEAANADERIDFASFGAAGSEDFNYSEMRDVHRRLESWKAPQRLEIFDGGHAWMPEAVARLGVEWLEVRAIVEGRRASDETLLAQLYDRDIGAARALEESDRPLAAVRRYSAIVEVFGELRDVSSARAGIERLDSRADVTRALKQEKQWDHFEAEHLAKVSAAIAALGAVPPITAARFVSVIDIEGLEQRAARTGYEGTVARRLLNTVLTLTSFYLTRQFFEQEDFSSAVKVLTAAVDISPSRPDIWYNLACAHARLGHEQEALEALEQALACGYSDRELLTTDSDLESIRDTPAFRDLLAALED